MILVTGGTGFVGGALLRQLVKSGFFSRTCSRGRFHNFGDRVEMFTISELDASTDWAPVLDGVDRVVHCAARVHVMHDDAADPLKAYREVNLFGTLNLARQAASAGVRRFIFISSIKVNGEFTHLNHPFSADDIPAPLDAYGLSKLEAEQGLRQIELQTGMEVVIVRPPLVHGPGVKANFGAMISWLASGIPLPFGAIHNARSVVALDNLINLLIICLTHPAAAGQTFLVSDGQDVSTTELLRLTAKAMEKKIILLPVPAFLIELVASLFGRRAMAKRLCGTLQVDIGKTQRLLGWTPPLTLEQGLKQTVGVVKL